MDGRMSCKHILGLEALFFDGLEIVETGSEPRKWFEKFKFCPRCGSQFGDVHFEKEEMIHG
jgi:NADH pyrophosphatase NudC (nudix superfamily)